MKMLSSGLWGRFALICLAACSSPYGCSQPVVENRLHEVVDPMGHPMAHGATTGTDVFDWQHEGPQAFLSNLRTVQEYTVAGIHRGWVRASDLSELVALLDSHEPCGSVAMAISSYHESQLSTVGQEAAFLIEGFRRGAYPPALNSTHPGVDKAEVRAWWEAYKQSKGET
jgi:hypothetical protein